MGSSTAGTTAAVLLRSSSSASSSSGVAAAHVQHRPALPPIVRRFFVDKILELWPVEVNQIVKNQKFGPPEFLTNIKNHFQKIGNGLKIYGAEVKPALPRRDPNLFLSASASPVSGRFQ